MGNLYAASDTQVLKIDTNDIVSIYAGTTISGYSGDGGPATDAEIYSPDGLQMDAEGNLYIDDVGNYRVRKVDAAGIITTIAGNGVEGYAGDGGPATAAKLYLPTGVFPDRCGNVYIADYAGHRIRRVSGSGWISTFAGNGHYGYTGNGGPATAAEMNSPEAVYLDNSGNVYIADEYNFAVRYIQMDSCVNTTGIASPGLSKGEEEMRVWPNPVVSGVFNVHISSGINETVQVTVSNMVGEVVQTLPVATNRDTEIALHAPPGVYFVTAVCATGRYVQKIIAE
jgi:hypothetical protein